MKALVLNFKSAPYGIKQEYTFYQDFQIADKVGGQAGVKDTFARVSEEWLDNPQAWGEVVCALNWRLWDLYKTDEPMAKLYQQLCDKANELGWSKADKDEAYARTFFKVTD